MEFKIVILGKKEVGKTSIINRHFFGKFDNVYKPTLSVGIFPIQYYTNYGIIKLNILDFPDYDKHNLKLDGCIAVIDQTKESFDEIKKQTDHFKKINGNSPIITVVNKTDINCPKLYLEEFPDALEISAKNNTHLNTPFLLMLKKLTGKNNLEFYEEPTEK
jgi:small GTP-binding protein